MLEFDAASHTYTLDGQPVPSVTTVLSQLQDWSRVPANVLNAAADFGTNVHAACHYFDRGELAWSTLDPALVPYVEAWQKFVNESGATVIDSELRVASKQHRYAGTMDALVDWRNVRCAIDRKTGSTVPATAGPQLAAYARAHDEMFAGLVIRRRFVVHLRGDGQYRVVEYKNPTDWNIFHAALILHNWRNANAA